MLCARYVVSRPWHDLEIGLKTENSGLSLGVEKLALDLEVHSLGFGLSLLVLAVCS